MTNSIDVHISRGKRLIDTLIVRNPTPTGKATERAMPSRVLAKDMMASTRKVIMKPKPFVLGLRIAVALVFSSSN